MFVLLGPAYLSLHSHTFLRRHLRMRMTLILLLDRAFLVYLCEVIRHPVPVRRSVGEIHGRKCSVMDGMLPLTLSGLTVNAKL